MAPQGNSTGPTKPKAAPKKAAEAPKAVLQLQDGRFIDHRWENGRWTLSKFANPSTGQMDWPAWNSVRFSSPIGSRCRLLTDRALPPPTSNCSQLVAVKCI